MNEFDTRIFDLLDAFTPEQQGRADWSNVLRRARSSRVRRVFLLLAAAVAVLASAVGVAAALGGFDRWLSGAPGRPASSAEQGKFERANGRSWAAFPNETKLRELINTSVDGKKYVLFGFRSGSTLCLQLKAVTLGHSTHPSCTPASTLANSTAPIVVVNRDFGFQGRHARESAQYSFGIVADGVKRVDVMATDGPHPAAVGGNAYLFVENEPNTGNRVMAITAIRSDGTHRKISFPTTFGPFWFDQAGSLPARGPMRVEAPIKHPKIGWYERGERRGIPRAQLRLEPQQRSGSGISATGRFIKPDPFSDVVVGLDGNLCLIVIADGSGMGCSPPRQFFSRGGLNPITSGGAGTQSFVVAGAATDGIDRIKAFGADSQDQAVPLRDNLFALRVPSSSFPLKLVGYNHSGRVAAIVTLRSGIFDTVPPNAWKTTAESLHREGPNGAGVDLRIGRDVQDVRCWRARFSTGQSRRGCIQIRPLGGWVSVDLVQQAGGDLFVIGETNPPVTSVRLEFADGGVLKMGPVKGMFVFAIPRRYLGTERRLAYVRGYDRHGKVVQRAAAVFKLRAR